MNIDNLKEILKSNRNFISIIIISVSTAFLLTLLLILKTNFIQKENEIFVADSIVEHSCRKPLIIKKTTDEAMSCSNFSLNKTSLTKGETLTINYKTANIGMSEVRMRKYNAVTNAWGEWETRALNNFVIINNNTPSFSYTIPNTMEVGKYELGVITYNGTSNETCTKQCGILNNGTSYTQQDDYDGLCPTQKYYTTDMGNQTEECSNNCRMTFNVINTPITDSMSCKNLTITNANDIEQDGDGNNYYIVNANQSLNLSYATANITTTDLRLRTLYLWNETTQNYERYHEDGWGEWSLESLAQSTGVSGTMNYNLANQNLVPGIYELGLITYDSECSKLCSILNNGSLITPNTQHQYPGQWQCPSILRYTPEEFDVQDPNVCSNTCRTRIKILPNPKESVSLTGQVYCQDPGGPKYPMNNVSIALYNDITKRTLYRDTNNNGNFIFSKEASFSAKINEPIAIRLNDLRQNSLTNGQSYSNLNLPPEAINCNNNDLINCTKDPQNNPYCSENNSSYEHCVLQNQEHSNFDLVFTNCEPTTKCDCSELNMMGDFVIGGSITLECLSEDPSTHANFKITYQDGTELFSQNNVQEIGSNYSINYSVPEDIKDGEYKIQCQICNGETCSNFN